MSNRKKERMDAIERRLAELDARISECEADEGCALGRIVAIEQRLDPPEFSCQPMYEPDDDRVIREAREAIAEGLATGRCGKYSVEDRGTWPPSEVRERVRERSELADALAGIRDLYAVECSDADLLAKAAHEIRERRRNA